MAQKKVGFTVNSNVQGDSLIINNGLTASVQYKFEGTSNLVFQLPKSDGLNGWALKTDGAGNLTFGTVSVTSSSGTSGTSGTSGSSGSSGTSGANGSSGTSGVSGSSGSSGVSGSSGSSGSSGTSGSSGSSGAIGATGPSGSSGTSGANGSSGTSGSNGSSGTSGANGSSGTSGANGVGNATMLGTTNYVAKFTGATAVGNSFILSPTTERDNMGVIAATAATAVSAGDTYYHLSMANPAGAGIWKLGYIIANGDFVLDRWASGAYTNRVLNIPRLSGTPQVQFFDGSFATPSISFQSDADTGLYRPYSNAIGFAAAGTSIAFLDRSGTINKLSLLNAVANQESQLELQSNNGAKFCRFFFRGDDTTTNFGWFIHGGTGSALTRLRLVNTDTTTNGIRMAFGENANDVINIGANANPATGYKLKVTGKTEMSDIVAGADGTAAAPQYTFTSDTDTGIYRVADNRMGISTGGTLDAIFGATNSFANRTYFNAAVNHQPVVNASVSGTYSLDMSASNVFNLTLTGNTTLTTTNQYEGSYVILVKQDGTGSRTLTLHSDGRFIGTEPLSISTTANSKSIIQLVHIGTQSVVVSQKNLITL